MECALTLACALQRATAHHGEGGRGGSVRQQVGVGARGSKHAVQSGTRVA